MIIIAFYLVLILFIISKPKKRRDESLEYKENAIERNEHDHSVVIFENQLKNETE